jgi:hypothetical protein
MEMALKKLNAGIIRLAKRVAGLSIRHPSRGPRAVTSARAASLAAALILLGLVAPAHAQELLETLSVLPGTTSANRVTTSTSFDAPRQLVITGIMKRAFTTGDLGDHFFDALYCFGGSNLCSQPEPFFGLQVLDASGTLVRFVEQGTAPEPPFSPEHRYAVTPIVTTPGPISFLARPFGNPDVGNPVFLGSFQIQRA